MKKILLLLSMTMLALSGCGGGGSKADVSIYFMPAFGAETEVIEKIKEQLAGTIDETLTIEVSGHGTLSQEKVLIELTGSRNHIVMLPHDVFLNYTHQNTFVPLEDVFDQEAYPKGVLEIVIRDGNIDNRTKETHLYGIPVHSTRFLEEAGYDTDLELYAAVTNVGSAEQSKEILKAIMDY